MKRKTKRRSPGWMVVIFLAACVLSWFGSDFSAKEQEVEKDVTKAPRDVSKSQTPTSATQYSALEDLDIDLVVSKVVMHRGEYNGGRTVEVIPYVKNMCNGNLSGNIKVSLPELGTAVWIRTGIGPQEEKSTGALYYCELSECDLGPFSVVVDSDNDIEENNESNNRCTGITFGASETNKTHGCPIQGPHCYDAPAPGKDRTMDPVIR